MSLPVSEYKIIHGTIRSVESELTTLAMKGWKPILFSTTVVGPPATPLVNVTMVLEHVPGAGS